MSSHLILCFVLAIFGASGNFAAAFAAAKPVRSVLILDQSTKNAPWSVALQSSLLAALNSRPGMQVAVYVENLDFGLFGKPEYDEQLRVFLSAKYRDVHPELIVVIGARTLEFVARSRSQLWPKVPVVFSAVDEAEAAKVRDIPEITGTIMRLPLGDLAAAARIAVPKLSSLVIVGDPFQRQPYRGHFTEELAGLKKEMNVIDLTGLPVAELRKRVSSLKGDTVIAYTNIYGGGDGLVYTPAEALSILAGIANRPIVVDVETFVGTGSVGGFVVRPGPIGEEAARLALRILGGEAASDIPVSIGNFKKPVFDWRQLQRWHIDESSLPAESEIRFRSPTAWEQYHTQIVLTLALLVTQSALIIGLVYERRRRQRAEIETRHRMSELARVNRIAAAGVLSASIAHEINQPLSAIVSNGDAGLLWLGRSAPDVKEAMTALNEIVRQGHRVNGIITAVRSLFKQQGGESTLLDVNELLREVLVLFQSQMQRSRIVVRSELADDLPKVLGERTQLQQVISNLTMNAVEAISSTSGGPRMIKFRSRIHEDSVVVSVEDSGPGIDEENLARIFDVFFTTKPNGMGVGLAICKSIAEAHGGNLRAASNDQGGATFSLILPRPTATPAS